MDTTPDPLAERLGGAVSARLLAAPADTPGSDPSDVAAATRAWSALCEIEAPAFEAPVGVGGYDLGLASGVAVSTQLGHHGLPDVYNAIATTVDALAAVGDDRVGQVANLAAGGRAVRLAGMDGATAGGPPPLIGRRAVAGWVLSGSLPRDAARSPGGWLAPFLGDGEIQLALIDDDLCPAPPGPGREHMAIRHSTITDLTLDASGVVGRLGSGWPLSDPDGVLARLRLRHAGHLHGLAQRAHELAVGHALRRRQFGRRLMEFQGVAFPLAQAQVSLAATQLMVRRAAWLADAGRPCGLPAVEALAMAGETALRTVRTAVQAHGARGLARSAPISRCYLRTCQEVTRLGSPYALWREAGARRLELADDDAGSSRESFAARPSPP